MFNVIVLSLMVCMPLFASEPEKQLACYTTDDYIECDNLLLKKTTLWSSWRDANTFIELAQEHATSEFMFGARATQEDIARIIKPSLKNKLLATTLFAASNLLQHSRWMITDTQTKQVIGSVGLSPLSHPQIIKLIYDNDENNTNVMGLGLMLQKDYWQSTKLRSSILTFLQTVFNTHKTVNGIAVCINEYHEAALNCVRNSETQQAIPPFVYCGKADFPEGFTAAHPKAFKGECYLVKNDSALDND
ncbi:hypothetical protein Noda2021_09240 [Candidatus Dependentiae bacterium Noda2021]|nr:hypothetical protein Noda2021_09240 [Candidatus Dependentiae bacterium Noda2021]